MIQTTKTLFRDLVNLNLCINDDLHSRRHVHMLHVSFELRRISINFVFHYTSYVPSLYPFLVSALCIGIWLEICKYSISSLIIFIKEISFQSAKLINFHITLWFIQKKKWLDKFGNICILFSFSATNYAACTGRRKKRAVSLIDEQAAELEVGVPDISVSRVER